MNCFNGDKEVKRRLLDRARDAGLRAKRGDDRKKIFWSRRSWCQAGYVCSAANCDHSFYTNEIGVPLSIAYAERAIFNELPDSSAGRWPERFLNALSTEVDGSVLESVWRQMALFVLADSKHGLITIVRTPEQTDAVMRVVELFESRSSDASAWKEAASFARKVSHSGPDTNCRLESADAFVAAGAKACYAASLFASAFENPRYAADALSWAPWAFRYNKYAELMRAVKVDEVPADERGMVNVGASLWAHSVWMRKADACEHEGESLRQATYELYADEFVRLIQRCMRTNTPGIAARVANACATAWHALRFRRRGFASA